MKSLDTHRLRRDLRGIVQDVEDALESMADATEERAGDLKSHAGRRLHDVRARLAELEHEAADGARSAGRSVRNYVYAHPWIVIGGFVALMLVSGTLSRTRQ